MNPDNDFDLSFHVEKKAIQNLKYFILKDKKYPIDFDLLKKNSQYFYRYRKQFNNTNKIFLLNDTEESLLDISEGVVQSFAASCSNEPCKIRLSDVIALQYLSYKFEFQELITITNKFVEDHWESLVLPSLLFKLKIRPNNNRKDKISDELNFYFNTQKEEEIIISHLNEYIKKEEMLLLPISTLDFIFHNFFNSKSSKSLKKNSPEIIEFLFKCLDKYGIDASILFSYVDFEDQSIGIVNRLIKNYSEKFDFNMINSTLLKTTTQLSSELTRFKEECSIMFSQQIEIMKQQFNEQQIELMKMKKEEVERIKELNEKIKMIEDENEKKLKEREMLFNKQMILMKEEYEEKMKIIIANEEEKSNERERMFQDQMNKLKKKKIKKKIKRKQSEKSNEKENKNIIKKDNDDDDDDNDDLIKESEKEEEENKTDDEEENDNENLKVDREKSHKSDPQIPYEIFIRNTTGKSNVIKVQQDFTIEKLKQLIEDKEGIPSIYQLLVYSGKPLENDRTLQYYSIQKCSTIFLFIHMVHQGNEIFIKLLNGQNIKINYHANDRIGFIKEKIEQKIGIPSEKQRLVYKGRELENESTLKECSICCGYQLYLVLLIKFPKLYVQKANGQKIILEFSKEDRIIDIKTMITRIEKCPLEKLILFYNGKKLRNNRTLDELNIEEKSTLKLVVLKHYFY